MRMVDHVLQRSKEEGHLSVLRRPCYSFWAQDLHFQQQPVACESWVGQRTLATVLLLPLAHQSRLQGHSYDHWWARAAFTKDSWSAGEWCVWFFRWIHLWYPVVPFVFFSILSHPFAHPRIWCLFEVYQTICLSRNGRSQGLLLCTSTGVLQEGNAGTDVAVAVARKSLGFAEYVLFFC